MKKMLIFVDSSNNNNKFYSLELVQNDVHTAWGRVGNEKFQKKVLYGVGEKGLLKKMHEKIKKGYVEAAIDTEIEEENISSNKNMLEIVTEQIQMDEFSKKLLKRLVEKNIHNIVSNTKIKFDINTGYFKTPLGIVTIDGVNKAIILLEKIEKLVKNSRFNKSKKEEFIELNEDYFIKIPTKIKNLRDFNSLLNSIEKIEEQKDICNSLKESIKLIEDEKNKQKDSKKIITEKIFDTEVKLLTDKKEFNRIVEYFEHSKNKQHGYSVNNAKIENIYKINLKNEEKNYRYDLNNQMELFHGTKVANLLSILKSGLLMPKYSPGSTTGYMFGQGLYFSDQSTKSINYCDGMFWNNSIKQDRIYMFITDIAMGNYQIPTRPTSRKPDKNFDSYFAKPNRSGIRNNEMIIFNNNQIKLKYILEIKLN